MPAARFVEEVLFLEHEGVVTAAGTVGGSAAAAAGAGVGTGVGTAVAVAVGGADAAAENNGALKAAAGVAAAGFLLQGRIYPAAPLPLPIPLLAAHLGASWQSRGPVEESAAVKPPLLTGRAAVGRSCLGRKLQAVNCARVVPEVFQQTWQQQLGCHAELQHIGTQQDHVCVLKTRVRPSALGAKASFLRW